ncbi:PaaI family thioesterase [Euzebya tangerina]|uniref:PaaI family thioesterase n=1 Tax=Euzebya tangerina TaxID=591198 RepID=UPI0013C2A4C3|nr:PaaI family thioesterase [Euzebya tangerina]
MPLDIATARTVLATGFSPWVGQLDLGFEEITPSTVTMRMPFSPDLCREGGIICGQAFMALADTASVFGMWTVAGEMRRCTTVDISVQMMRPVSDADVIAETRVLRLGRSMAFVQVVQMADGDPRPAVNATVTLALL